jgi:hypothetical protein
MEVTALANGVDQPLTSLLPLELAQLVRDVVWRMECPDCISLLDIIII